MIISDSKGIEEYEQESWTDTEKVLKHFLSRQLGLHGIDIQLACETGRKDKNYDTPRTIVANFNKE